MSMDDGERENVGERFLSKKTTTPKNSERTILNPRPCHLSIESRTKSSIHFRPSSLLSCGRSLFKEYLKPNKMNEAFIYLQT